MTALPYDVLRIILSAKEIPCTTKVEFHKNLGNLTNRIVISPELKNKLDRVMANRHLSQRKPTKRTIESDDGKVSLTILMNHKNKCMYQFRYKNDVDTEIVSYDNILTDNEWQRHSSRCWN